MRTFAMLAPPLLALSLAGCCQTWDTIIAMERTADDAAVDCQDICKRALVPLNKDDQTIAFLECEDGSTEEGAPAALCTFVVTHCPE
jgi:hypothetical protein